jgi:hypothetical protein
MQEVDGAEPPQFDTERAYVTAPAQVSTPGALG